MTQAITRIFSYGQLTIRYELWQTNRKSLEIAVHPDKRVVVKAPASYSIKTIEDSVRKRARWIDQQISWFTQFEPRTPSRQYVGGESHLYLGRKYRLKIELSDREVVLLKHGYFRILCLDSSPTHIKSLMDAWYRGHAKRYLTRIFDDCWQSFSKRGKLGIDGNKKVVRRQPLLALRKMKTRWGSLSTLGRLTLNSNLIQVPRECIEYVVYHELCHLYYHNHSPEYYRLLGRILPDWKRRKQKLEMSLI